MSDCYLLFRFSFVILLYVYGVITFDVYIVEHSHNGKTRVPTTYISTCRKLVQVLHYVIVRNCTIYLFVISLSVTSMK